MLNKIINKLISGKLIDGLYTKANLSFQDQKVFIDAANIANNTINYRLNIPFRLHQALFCLESTLTLPGDIIELGVGKGYLFSGIIGVFESQLIRENKDVYLVDLYKPFENNTTKVSEGSLKKHIYASDVDSVISTFSKYDFVNIIEGRCPEILSNILPKIKKRKISFLHVDLNHHVAEIESLELLFPYVVKGGIILLDDYANPERTKQYQAFGKFFKSKQLPILTLATGQGIVINR
jgi:O-methyltransferase